jgi:hypothetical protein
MRIRYPIATVKFSELEIGDRFYFIGTPTYLYFPEVYVKTTKDKGFRKRDGRRGVFFDCDILVRAKK